MTRARTHGRTTRGRGTISRTRPRTPRARWTCCWPTPRSGGAGCRHGHGPLRGPAGLARRRNAGPPVAGLGAELGRIAAGRSERGARPKDRRFADPAWAGNPVLHRVLQAYLAGTATLADLQADADAGLDGPGAGRLPAD